MPACRVISPPQLALTALSEIAFWSGAPEVPSGWNWSNSAWRSTTT